MVTLESHVFPKKNFQKHNFGVDLEEHFKYSHNYLIFPGRIFFFSEKKQDYLKQVGSETIK